MQLAVGPFAPVSMLRLEDWWNGQHPNNYTTTAMVPFKRFLCEISMALLMARLDENMRIMQ